MARPTFRVEMTIGVPTGNDRFLIGDATEGVLGTSPLGGVPFGAGTWVDVSDYVMFIDVQAGRQRLLGRDVAGRCSITLDNSDRRFDPTDLNGPYVDAGVSLVRPMCELRITVEVLGSDFIEVYTLFHGTVDSWDLSWSDPGDAEVVVNATDGLKLLERAQLATVAAVGADETVAARVARILDAAGWSSDLRDIDSSADSLVAATTHGSTALAALQALAASDLGRLVMIGNTVTYRGRQWRDAPANRTVRFTFTDAEPSNLSELNYDLRASSVRFDDELVVNHAEVTPSGGTVQTVDDTASQALYGVRGYTLSSVLSSTADAINHATRVTNLYADPELRFDRIVLSPDGYDPDDTDVTAYRACLRLSFDDRVRVKRTPPKASGTNAQIERLCFVEGYHHRIGVEAGGGWVTELSLSDAESWPDPFIIGSSLIGTGTVTW